MRGSTVYPAENPPIRVRRRITSATTLIGEERIGSRSEILLITDPGVRVVRTGSIRAGGRRPRCRYVPIVNRLISVTDVPYLRRIDVIPRRIREIGAIGV